MRSGLLAKCGVAAVILFAPGGFLLGAAMAADHYRKSRRKGLEEPAQMPAC
jgi:hypothetical protein